MATTTPTHGDADDEDLCTAQNTAAEVGRMIFVGLDPAGKRKFGWAVLAGAGPPLSVLASGCVDHAAAAIDAVQRLVEDVPKAEVAGVGIDSPLFWTPSGHRHADSAVRRAMKSEGAPNLGGTVQEVNSLRGACVTQGVVAAHLLRKLLPTVRITEAHPKALLWLINVASTGRQIRDVGVEHLAEYVSCKVGTSKEHERDAILGGIGAWAMTSAAPGWRDVSIEDRDAIRPVPGVEYWMPVE